MVVSLLFTVCSGVPKHVVVWIVYIVLCLVLEGVLHAG